MDANRATSVSTGEAGLARGAQLFGLSAMAVGQPLLDLIARHPAFLVAHRASPLTIWSLTAGLLVGPPLLLWMVESGAYRLSRGFASWLRIALTGALAAAIALPIAKHASAVPAIGMLSIAAGVGVLVAVGYARSRLVGRFLTILGVAPFAAAILFAVHEPIARLLHPQPGRAAAALATTADLPPILFVIFDELPLTSLLDEQEQIDPVRYPAFARLAATSTWFRGATTVNRESILAVPAILTGRYPNEGKLPTANDHPENLFSLLGARYRIHADEPVTMLYDAPRSAKPDTIASLMEIADDLRTIYLHFLLPAEFTAGLPSLAQTWKGFGEDDDPLRTLRVENPHSDRIQRLDDFTASIDESASDEPTLYFLHNLLPHPPWEHLPSGRVYFPANAGIPHHSWGPEDWWAIQGYQQHLLQLIYTDKRLGWLFDRLDRAGLFDAAMIVVTSDHGATFWPNSPRRGVQRHPEDVLSVPLIIKAPHQRRARTIDRVVESVDILPSVADLLGIEIPWAVDGCSAYDDSCAERTERVMDDLHFSADTPMRRESLALKLELFGSGTSEGSALGGLYEIGPRPQLLGRAVREFDRSRDQSVARIVQGAFALAALQPERYVAARITGLVVGPRAEQGPAQIAVSIKGIIRAVVPALPFKDQGLLFSALIPEEFAPAAPRFVKIFAVEGTSKDPKLSQLRVRFEAFRPR